MKKILWIVFPLVILLIVLPFLQTDDTEKYREQFEEEKEKRIRYLKHNDQSPFNQFDIPFQKPEYFPYDPSFRVQARVNRVTSRDNVIIQTSDGNTERYTKYAYLEFTLKSQPLRLLVLKPAGFGAANVLYCAFSDETSTETTYGGGRYLDVSIGKSDKTIIDFNLAYNPYCAYAPDYSCPLPPPENILPIAINAGEKDYK